MFSAFIFFAICIMETKPGDLRERDGADPDAGAGASTKEPAFNKYHEDRKKREEKEDAARAAEVVVYKAAKAKAKEEAAAAAAKAVAQAKAKQHLADAQQRPLRRQAPGTKQRRKIK